MIDAAALRAQAASDPVLHEARLVLAGDDVFWLGTRGSVFAVSFDGDAAAIDRIDATRDPKLRGVGLLHDRSALAALLGADASEIHGIDVVAYRPRRRLMARVRCGDRQLWLKLLTRSGYRRFRPRFDALSKRASTSPLVLPTRSDDKHAALVFDHVAGPSLLDWLARTAEARTDGEELATELEAALGALAMIPCADLPERSLEDERKACLTMLQRGSLLRPSLAELGEAIQGLALPNARTDEFVHGDLHDKQILLPPDDVAVIDCDMAARGDARLDRVNLVEHLRLRELQDLSPQRSGELAALLCASFGLDASVDAIRALVRARLAGVYALRPKWWRVSERLQREALDLIDPRG